MKIICVVGGSYKSFYLNAFNKIKTCDLLIFNYGIIYDYNTKEELLGTGVVTKELMALSQELNCTVVAGVNQIIKRSTKSIIVCDGDKIHISPAKTGVCLRIKKHDFFVGDENSTSSGCNKILLCSKRVYPNAKHCSKTKTYLFIDNFGVSFVQNKKQSRKFNKITKIILK